MVEKSHTAASHDSEFWPHVLDPLRNARDKIANFFAPSADAASTDDVYEVNIELPGVSSEDVDVELHDNVLVVKGEKSFENEETGKTYYFSERRFGSFHRSFRLPEDVDPEKVTAAFSDGVLTIKVVKKLAARQSPKKIAIQKT